MKLLDLLKNENLCKFRKEAEIRLKEGRIKIDGVTIKVNIELDIIGEIIAPTDWLYKQNLTELRYKQLMLFCTPPQPSSMPGLDYIFDKSEKWEDENVMKLFPFLQDINDDKIKLLQISKREKFIIS